MKDVLFVYGTLMRNGRANTILRMMRSEFLGEARLDGYSMYDLGPFPGIAPDPDGSVRGEAWRVSERCLKLVDGYEGVDNRLYERRLEEAETDTFGKVKAWVYAYCRPTEGLKKVPAGQAW
ncbi:MAG TPA: gamma-glutamylcyclotransferase family protein, partial [Candidatus Limnocylindria bacterium]|nr:gamma-glutamylcyclotransferase family protein [Candidatus Limnocylindria bacterium]